MPVPTSIIKFSDIQNELNFSGNPQTRMSLLYSSSLYTASAYTDTNCLMYHNMAIGNPSSPLTAKQAIYDNFNTGSNMSFENWGSYNKDPSMVVTFTINNNTAAYNINGNIYIYDGTNDWLFYSFNTNFGGGPDTQTDYNTGVLTNKVNAKYWIKIDATAFYFGGSPSPGVTGNTTSASDSDGVGDGTTRSTSAPSNFDELNPLPLQIIVGGDNIATGIGLNKRTTFTVDFN
jgi:hypothetical protein